MFHIFSVLRLFVKLTVSDYLHKRNLIIGFCFGDPVISVRYRRWMYKYCLYDLNSLKDVPWLSPFHSHLTAEPMLQSQASPSTNFGGQIGIGTGYLRVDRFSPLSIIPPLPMLILILILFLAEEQAGEDRQLSNNTMFFRISRNIENKVKNALSL